MERYSQVAHFFNAHHGDGVILCYKRFHCALTEPGQRQKGMEIASSVLVYGDNALGWSDGEDNSD